MHAVHRTWSDFQLHEGGVVFTQQGSSKLLFAQLPLPTDEPSAIFLFGSHAGKWWAFGMAFAERVSRGWLARGIMECRSPCLLCSPVASVNSVQTADSIAACRLCMCSSSHILHASHVTCMANVQTQLSCIPHQLLSHTGEVLALAKLGSLLVSGCAAGVVKMWDVDDGQLIDTKVEPGGPRITALQGVGPFMVSVAVQAERLSRKGRGRWSQQDRWKASKAGNEPTATAVASACASASGLMRTTHQTPELGLSFHQLSPSHHFVSKPQVAVGSHDGTITILDITTQRLKAVHRFHAGPGPVTALAACLPPHLSAT